MKATDERARRDRDIIAGDYVRGITSRRHERPHRAVSACSRARPGLDFFPMLSKRPPHRLYPAFACADDKRRSSANWKRGSGADTGRPVKPLIDETFALDEPARP